MILSVGSGYQERRLRGELMIDDAAFVALLESCGQPSWIYDAATLDLLDVNDAAVDLFECRRDALLRSKLTDLLAELHHHFNVGETRLSEGTDGAAQRLCLKTSLGRRFPALVKDFPISRSGRPARIAIAYPASRPLQPDIHNATKFPARPDGLSNRAYISQKLVRADAALAAAANLMRFAIWELNLESGALSWSASLYDLIDAAPEDLEPTLEGYFSRLHPEDRDATILRFENFMTAQEEYLHFAHRLIKRDGSLLYVRGSARHTSIDGQDWLVGMIMDDTARCRNEAVLADARALLKIAGVSAQFGGWKFDVRNMRFKWSMGASETLDWFNTSTSTAEETIALFPVEYRSRAEQLLGEAIRNAKDFDELLPVERQDGQKLWLRVCGIPTTDEIGQVTDIVGSFQDVTPLIEERNRAAELASKLVSTLEEMSDAFYLLDHQFRIAYVNTKAMELAGRAQGEVLGQNVWDAFPEVARMEVRPNFEAAIKEQKSVEFTYFHDGWGEWFRVHATPVSEGLAVYFRDVTSEYEEAQRLALLESAIARQNDLVLIFDVDEEGNRSVAYTNNAFTQKLGYLPSEVDRPPRTGPI
jgi:PAS domain S-box-containing protein